jgi:2-polyprenyl-3-methyl-5-hydroxy-6-metoxy-1,4-benzoquinol methylase
VALRDRLLGSSLGYRSFRTLIKADRSTRLIADQYIRVPPGGRVLDVGCGNGDLAKFVPADSEYVGVDHNASYIASATRGPGQRSVRFVDADVSDLAQLDIGRFDVIVALGVVHHLDDTAAAQLVEAAHELLAANGRLVLIDPAFHPDQRATARVLMALDRGRFVRHPGDYERLAASAFDKVTVTVRHDLNPFPYPHCIVEAST